MVKVFLDNFSNFLAFREKASTFLCLCGGSESNLVFTENCGIFDDIVKMVITTKIIQFPSCPYFWLLATAIFGIYYVNDAKHFILRR